jgi:error-prone DNA polymerase
MPSRERYSELHCHSGFSFLDGASNPEDLAQRAHQIGLSALALTDHDDLGGIPRFAESARQLNLAAIIGAELTLVDRSHIIVLCQNLEGYKNLSALITLARTTCERGSPRLTYEDLFARAEGLIALSGCQHGAIPSAIARGETKDARRRLRDLTDAFPGRFYLEVGHHAIAQEALLTRQIIEMSASTQIPWVVTNNVHYATADKRIVHDVLTCIKHSCTLATAGRRLRPNGSYFLRSPDEMVRLWRDDLTGIRNTMVIAEQCRFRLGWLEPPLPSFTMCPEAARAIGLKIADDAVPIAVVDEDMVHRERKSDIVHVLTDRGLMPSNETYSSLLRRMVADGAADRYGELSAAHNKQIEHELRLIDKLRLAPYFLIMWDIVRFAMSRGIAVQGRGSAANSAVCYCLKITAVDPIGMDLLFERFISEGRNEPPDIDLDIAHQEREQVLQYVYQKYGRRHAAMVCEVSTYRGRSAIRDAARVLGFSQDQADLLAGDGHHREAREAAQKLAAGGLIKLGFDPEDRRVKLLLEIVSGLHQLPRHRSIHVGGFVLSANPIGEVVPVEPASMQDRTVIQWDKDDIDIVGLIKIDLLGLGMLMMLQNGFKLVEQYRGKRYDIGKLDMTDQNVYGLMQRADTVGIFQIESRAQMSILPKIAPKCFYDIIISIAIVRPGPIQGNIVHPYLRRRRGDEKVTYLHPSLEPILKRTLGVPLFQEQGMKLAVVAAGFTASQADQLRKVMSHKRSKEKMLQLCGDLAIGMHKNGFDNDAIATITHQLQAFSSYGFPESHAASFSLLVYASAFLKYYYAPEFFCAILNAQPMGFYSPATLIRDAAKHGVVVLPVDLSQSLWDCSLQQNGDRLDLRLGLRYVSGLGERARIALQDAWSKGGPFVSLEDVVERSGLDDADLKLLAKAGAFKCFAGDRRQSMWQVLSAVRPKRKMPLLEALTGSDELEDLPVILPAMTPLDEMLSDYRSMALSTGRHPMSFYRSYALRNNICSSRELHHMDNNSQVIVAGGAICRQRPETAKGFVFLTLEDESGMINIIIKPKIFDAYRSIIMKSSFLKIEGRLQLEHGVANVIAQTFEVLPPLSDEIVIDMPARNFH